MTGIKLKPRLYKPGGVRNWDFTRQESQQLGLWKNHPWLYNKEDSRTGTFQGRRTEESAAMNLQDGKSQQLRVNNTWRVSNWDVTRREESAIVTFHNGRSQWLVLYTRKVRRSQQLALYKMWGESKYDFTRWEESATLTLLDGRIQKLGYWNRENSATGTLQDRLI